MQFPVHLFICIFAIWSSAQAQASVIPINHVHVPNVRHVQSFAKRHSRFFPRHAIARRRFDRDVPVLNGLNQPKNLTLTLVNNVPLLTSTIPTRTSSFLGQTSTAESSSTFAQSFATPAASVTVTASPSVTSTVSPPSPLTTTLTSTDERRKYVVAHHMVGNTYPYTLQDWADDITLAFAHGIDGFALNVGIDEWEPARVNDAYEAAKQSGLGFKLFISLDMSSLPGSSPDDARRIRDFVKPFLDHPNQLRYGSRAFISTFAGESCTFGQVNPVEGWKTQFVKHSDLEGRIYFVPAFFIDPAKFIDFSDVIDGDFNWNSGWPIQLTTSFAKDLLSSQQPKSSVNANLRLLDAVVEGVSDALDFGLDIIESALNQFIGSTDSDGEHLKGLQAITGPVQRRDNGQQKPVYMGAVSPWFFTHYGQDSFNKNFIFLSDQHLYAKRWEAIISNRTQFDIVQVLTWNDYGESHYIGPIKGAQPNSEAWVNGFNHTGWLQLTRYYATAYKTGQFSTIEKDQIFMWSRPHPCFAKADDPVGPPQNFELAKDAVWALVMATAPSTVTISTSPTNTKQFQVPAGVSKLSVPISPGDTMTGTVQRDGKSIVHLAPSEFVFQGSPTSYNFNAFVASASAD